MDRIKAIRKSLRGQELGALVISHIPSIRYLTNFSGSNAIVVITSRNVHFITDGRYDAQVRTELFPLPGLKIYINRDSWGTIRTQNILKNVTTVGFEADHLSFTQVQNMRKQLRPVKCKPVQGVVEATTIPKTEVEVASIKKAARIGDKVYKYILDFVKPGMRESDIAAEINYQAAKLGSEEEAFGVIVASGPRGALPHGRASSKKVRKGELITLDYGCTVNGFHSDMTRTFALGQPKKSHRAIFDLVYQAHMASLEAIKAGMLAKELDAVARDIITQAGHGENFNHSLGHGLGINVHERPIISFRATKERIPAYAVITIEPGVYLAGKCGVRIEDDVWVKPDGIEILTKSPRTLVIV